MNRLEDLFLEAERELKSENYLEAKNLYEQVLEEDPEFAGAHNSLGWIYYAKFEDYRKAENHYRASIAFNKSYPHSFWNLVSVMIDEERFDEAIVFLNNVCMKTPILNKSTAHEKLAMIAELKSDFKTALEYYKKAVLKTCSNDKIEEFKKDIQRVEYKLSSV